MDDTKKKIIDVSVAVAIVLIMLVVVMPLFFPNSGINPLGLGKTNEGSAPTKVINEPPVKVKKPTKTEKPDTPAKNDSAPATAEKDLTPVVRIALVGLLVLVCLGAVSYGIYYYIKLQSYKTLAREMVYFKVMPSSDFKLPNMAYAKYFLINLSKHLQSPWDPMFLSTPWCRFVYRKKMEDGNVEMVIGVPADRTEGFINAFKAYYPKVQLIDYFEVYEDTQGNKYRITSPTELLDDSNYGVSEFRLKSRHGVEALSPIKMYNKKSDEMDTLETIIASMGAGIVESEEVFVDITLKPVWSKRFLYDKGKKAIDKIRGNKSEDDLGSILNGAADELMNKKGSKSSSRKYSSNEYTKALISAIKQKCSAPERAYATNIRLYMRCENPEHVTMKLKGVVDGFETMAYINELESEGVYNKKGLWDRIYRGYPHPMHRMILSTAELVSFVRVLDSDSPMFLHTDHNDTMAIRAPSGFWEDETIEYLDMD